MKKKTETVHCDNLNIFKENFQILSACTDIRTHSHIIVSVFNIASVVKYHNIISAMMCWYGNSSMHLCCPDTIKYKLYLVRPQHKQQVHIFTQMLNMYWKICLMCVPLCTGTRVDRHPLHQYTYVLVHEKCLSTTCIHIHNGA